MNLTDILKGAFGVYRRHPVALFLIAAAWIPLTIADILVSSLFLDSWIMALIVLPLLSGILGVIPAAALVRAVADALEGPPPGFWQSYAAVISRLGRLALATLRFQITVQVLMLILVGIPLAIYLMTRWAFFLQTII